VSGQAESARRSLTPLAVALGFGYHRNEKEKKLVNLRFSDPALIEFGTLCEGTDHLRPGFGVMEIESDEGLVRTYSPARTAHWSLVIGHWSLVIGHWSLVIGFVPFSIPESQPETRRKPVPNREV